MLPLDVVAPALIDEFPEIEDATRFMSHFINVNPEGAEGLIANVVVADSRL